MKRTISFLIGIFLLPFAHEQARAQSTYTFRGVDVYRSRQVTAAQLEKLFRKRMVRYLAVKSMLKRGHLSDPEKMKAAIVKDARKLGKFAYLDIHLGRYLTSAESSAYVTFDIVDAADKKKRMPFYPPPQRTLADPGGLLAQWAAYDALGKQLRRAGKLPFARPRCPAFYCQWGGETPELKAIQQRFIQGVRPHRKELIEVLRNEKDPKKRATSLFILSYLSEGNEVVSLATSVLKDPALEVRKAGLSVLSDIALYHQDQPISLSKMIAVLDYPTTADRKKALSVLVGLSDNPSYELILKTQAAAHLMPLLRMKQPSVHDLAFTLLGQISKEPIGRREYRAWERWIKDQSVSKPRKGGDGGR